jgi:Copper amine oxidase N-terminal domain
MSNRYTSIKRTMALAGVAALSAGSFAFMLDTNIVIERALNSPTLTVKYDGASASLVELRVNGESLATKAVSATANKGEISFTLAVSDLKDGDNDVEIRLYDKTGKVVGTQKQKMVTDQNNKGPVYITGPKQGANVSGITEIKLGFGKELKNVWVSFFVDGDHKDITNTPPYVYAWDTQRESNGWHTVEAWAVDPDSNTYKSKQVRVFVNNPGGRTERHTIEPAEPAKPAPVAKVEPKNPAKPTEVLAPTKEPVKPPKVVNTTVNTVKPVEPSVAKSNIAATVSAKISKLAANTVIKPLAMGNQDMTPTGTRVAGAKPVTTPTPKVASKPTFGTKVPNYAYEAAGKAVSIETGTRLKGVTSFNVLLNGSYVEFDVQPRVDNGIPMTPFRHLMEKSGGKVKWLNNEKSVSALSDGKDIWFKVGDSTAKINNLPFTLELAPYIDRGRTIVPLSFMKDALDVNIQFDPATGHVLITKK